MFFSLYNFFVAGGPILHFTTEFFKMAGRPSSRKVIVEVTELMDVHQIVNEIWKYIPLLENLQRTPQCINWLAKRGLIKNNCVCNVCGQPCSLLNYASGIDGVRWGCNPCNFRQSIRTSSFFERSRMPLATIIMLMCCWSKDCPQKDVAFELGISKKTVQDWFNLFREECGIWIDNNNYNRIGGMDVDFQPITVEVDESYFFRRKYHRGRYHAGYWVFGGIERLENGGIGKCFLLVVPDRTANTLEEEIMRYILPGTHIVSDGWAAYGNIPRIADGVYTHSIVIHQNNFVDPNDSELHTQNVDNMWMRAKRKLKRQFGTSRALFTSYLDEFVFRNSFRTQGSVFAVFLRAIRENYID